MTLPPSAADAAHADAPVAGRFLDDGDNVISGG